MGEAQMEIVEDVVIVGAGIAGLTTSLGLHRLGLRSLVLESSDSLRATGFALTLWTNAWRALDAVGVGNHLRQHSVQIEGFQIVSADSGLPTSEVSLEEKYGNHESRCIKRSDLLEALEKELPRGTIRYSSKVVSIDELGDMKILQLADGSAIRTKVLVGCDGVNSVVARRLGLQKAVDAGRLATRGYVEYPDGHGLKPRLNVYFGGGVRFGFIPCDDKSLYWFCTYSASVANWHEDMAQNPAKLKQFVLSKTGNSPKEVTDFLERTNVDSISCAALKLRLPWDILIRNCAKNGIFIAGDALHPMTPDLGQGGCSALEDSVVLAKCIGESFLKIPRRDIRNGKEDIELALTIKKGEKKYTKDRRWRSFSLIAAAYVVGFLQESDYKVICFLREHFLAKYTAAAMLTAGDFDCGKLAIN